MTKPTYVVAIATLIGTGLLFLADPGLGSRASAVSKASSTLLVKQSKKKKRPKTGKPKIGYKAKISKPQIGAIVHEYGYGATQLLALKEAKTKADRKYRRYETVGLPIHNPKYDDRGNKVPLEKRWKCTWKIRILAL